MKKIILGTIFLFSSAIFAQVDSTQVSPEYKESSFQGDPETQPEGFHLKESDLIGNAWNMGAVGQVWGFYPNRLIKMRSKDGSTTKGLWVLDNNVIKLYNEDGSWSANITVESMYNKNELNANIKGYSLSMNRVNEINEGAIKSVTTTKPTPTKPKRKVNSPLPIMEKNMIGKWQAANGTMYCFFYNNYFKLYPPNKPMIDCRWGLNNGYVVLEVLGDVLMRPQVISVSKTKMILAMDGGDLHLTKL